MKDSLFRSNSKLFDEVESVKKSIRNGIRSQTRNCQSRSCETESRPDNNRAGGYNKALHRTSR